jgi:hypothetical protein
MNRVVPFSTGALTLTENPHVADLLTLSTAVHVTTVTPRGNVEPGAGEHEAVTGSVPPVVVGAA